MSVVYIVDYWWSKHFTERYQEVTVGWFDARTTRKFNFFNEKFFMGGSIVSANARNPRIRCNFSHRIGSQKRNLRFSELNLGICKPYTWKIVYHHIMNVICKIWHYIRFFIFCVRWKRLGYFILLSFIETLPKLIISA